MDVGAAFDSACTRGRDELWNGEAQVSTIVYWRFCRRLRQVIDYSREIVCLSPTKCASLFPPPKFSRILWTNHHMWDKAQHIVPINQKKTEEKKYHQGASRKSPNIPRDNTRVNPSSMRSSKPHSTLSRSQVQMRAVSKQHTADRESVPDRIYVQDGPHVVVSKNEEPDSDIIL